MESWGGARPLQIALEGSPFLEVADLNAAIPPSLRGEADNESSDPKLQTLVSDLVQTLVSADSSPEALLLSEGGQDLLFTAVWKSNHVVLTALVAVDVYQQKAFTNKRLLLENAAWRSGQADTWEHNIAHELPNTQGSVHALMVHKKCRADARQNLRLLRGILEA